MKNQVPTWIALTLLMLMLVLASAIVFLMQGRTALRNENELIQSTLSSLSVAGTTEANDVKIVEITIAPSMTPTSSILLVTPNTPVPDSDTPTPTIELPAFPQRLEIMAPEDNYEIVVGEKVKFVIEADDVVGIRMMSLSRNGLILEKFTPPDDNINHVMFTYEWEPTTDDIGTVVFTAGAVNFENETLATDILSLIVVDEQAKLDGLRTLVQTQVDTIRENDEVSLDDVQGLFVPVSSSHLAALADGDVERQREMLVAFDFISAEDDLAGLLATLANGDPLYYDLAQDRFVTLTNENGSPQINARMAYEYQRSLQTEMPDTLSAESRIAFAAMAEGDAMLMQSLFISTKLEPDEQERLANFDVAAAERVTNLPLVLQDALAFPFRSGFAFIITLYEGGGFEALTQAWENWPISSEQILHPDHYINKIDVTDTVSLPDVDTLFGTFSGWELIDDGTLGERMLEQHLVLQIPENDAMKGTSGWGGDYYIIVRNSEENQTISILNTKWDSVSEMSQFKAAYEAYANAKYSEIVFEETETGTTCWQADEGSLCYFRALDINSVLIIRGATPEEATDIAREAGFVPIIEEAGEETAG